MSRTHQVTRDYISRTLDPLERGGGGVREAERYKEGMEKERRREGGEKEGRRGSGEGGTEGLKERCRGKEGTGCRGEGKGGRKGGTETEGRVGEET